MADTQTVDAAMNTVLRAEKEARNETQACRRKAEKWLAEAREQARQISQRTDNRISALHAKCAADTNRRVDVLLQKESQPEQIMPLAQEKEVLRAAVELLASELTGKHGQ